VLAMAPQQGWLWGVRGQRGLPLPAGQCAV